MKEKTAGHQVRGHEDPRKEAYKTGYGKAVDVQADKDREPRGPGLCSVLQSSEIGTQG